MEALMLALVDVVKGAPSSTSRHQSCDVSANFRDWKTGMAKAQENGRNTKSPTLERNIRAFLQSFLEQPWHAPDYTLPQDFTAKLINAVEKIVYVHRAKYVTPEKSAEGFIRTGQHIREADPAKGECTVSYPLIMGKTMAACSEDELQLMKDVKPQVIAEALRCGRITNDFLDTMGVVSAPDATQRDNLTLCRQDTQLITHVDTIARFAEKQAAKEKRKDPKQAVLEVTKNKAQRLIDKHQATQQRQEEREAAKLLESQRRAQLTPQQRRLEDAVRAADNAAAAVAKKAAKDNALQQARELLSDV